MIELSKPLQIGTEKAFVLESLKSPKLSGDGPFGLKCQSWFEKELPCKKALMTPSCTAALELAAILLEVGPEDEVIMPSYTFVSTANAFALRGAKIVFVDIKPDTMNIDEDLIVEAITSKTKVIVPVHYAGVPCDMDKIMDIAAKYDLFVVEDAAQGLMSTYKDKALGTIGHLGTFSFHDTKNFTSGGEGGLLLVNSDKFVDIAEIVREKGTNRVQFINGKVDKYTWHKVGTSCLPSEIQSAYLFGQLNYAETVTSNRLNTWCNYRESLSALAEKGLLELPQMISDDYKHNGHIFFIKLKDRQQRTELIKYLSEREITSAFHYIPLHSSPAGRKIGYFHGQDKFTERESSRLLRLPLWYGMDENTFNTVVGHIHEFFEVSY